MKYVSNLLKLITWLLKVVSINFVVTALLVFVALSSLALLTRFDGMAQRLHLTPNTLDECKKTEHYKVSLHQAEIFKFNKKEIESYCESKILLKKDWIRSNTYWDYHYYSKSQLETPLINYFNSEFFNSRKVPCSKNVGDSKILNVWAFGGSTMENLETSDEKTIANTVCKRLSIDQDVSLMNLGIGSFYSEMEIHKLLNLMKFTINHEKVAPPDIAIFYNGYNDAIRLTDGKWSGIPRLVSDRYISASSTRSNLLESVYWFLLSARNFFLALTGDRANFITISIEKFTNKIANKKGTENLMLAKRIDANTTKNGLLVSSYAYLNDQLVLSGICSAKKIKCIVILQPVLSLRNKPVGKIENAVQNAYNKNGLNKLTIRFYNEVRNKIKLYENNYYKVIDLSNIINDSKYSQFPFFYDFGHTGFYASEIIGVEIGNQINNIIKENK